MSGKTITLIGSSPEMLSNSLIPTVLAHWLPEIDRPATVSLTFDQVLENEDSLGKCGVVWLHLNAHQPQVLYSSLVLLQDRQ